MPSNIDGADDDATEVESKLELLGLGGLQASTYLCLLKSGLLSANQIARKIHVNRTDIYRVLRELSTRGLVNTIMQSPNLYEAAKPNLTVKILITEMEDQVKRARSQAPDVLMSLDSIKHTEPSVEESKKRNIRFKLLTGKQVISAWNDLLRAANHEVIRLWSPEGIRTNYSQGFLENFKECISRGVKVRGIAEINKNNLFECEEFASLIELKHLDALADAVRYEIADRSEIIISSMNFKNEEVKLEGIRTNNEVLVNGFRKDFEDLWCQAIPAKVKIDELRKKMKAA